MKGLIKKVTREIGILSLVALFFVVSSPTYAGSAKKKIKRATKITFEECCEKNSNDTQKCSKMKGVLKKNKRVGKKWVPKSCPKTQHSEVDEMEHDEASEEGLDS